MDTSTVRKVRILIAEDHEMVASGLRLLLGQRPGFDVVGVAYTEEEAVARAASLRPDLVLMDAVLREGGGVKACEAIKKIMPQCKVVFLSAFAGEKLVIQAINAGANGYLSKDSSAERLLEALDQVLTGQMAMDVAATQRLAEGLQGGANAAAHAKLDLISRQERAVMERVSQGKTNKEIAVEMNLSDKTVKNYLSNAMKKLGFTRRSQVAAFFVQHAEDLQTLG